MRGAIVRSPTTSHSSDRFGLRSVPRYHVLPTSSWSPALIPSFVVSDTHSHDETRRDSSVCGSLVHASGRTGSWFFAT